MERIPTIRATPNVNPFQMKTNFLVFIWSDCVAKVVTLKIGPVKTCLGENIPDFITKILHHLELYGTMKEGIYRVPGAKLEVDRLKSKLDTDPHCINIDFDGFNVNAVAAAFKDFLRKLPVPLLPYDVRDSFVGPFCSKKKLFLVQKLTFKIQFYPDILRVMTNYQTGSGRDDRYGELTRILKELPMHHRQTIEKIFFHLASVARKSEENRMDPQALAIILAPCIIR